MDICIKINSPLLHCLGNTLSFSFSLDVQFMSDTVKRLSGVDYTPAWRVYALFCPSFPFFFPD